jgi:uncharacterized protein (TIGR02996 family)
MNDPVEQKLWYAVLADPDADDPRQKYAAWCAKQDDEATKKRAEFIDAQLALVDVFGDTDTYPLRNLVHTLEHKYGHIWAGEIAELVDDFQYDRGFIELVVLDAARFLDLAQRLFSLAPIRHLDLTGVKPVVEKLFTSPFLAGIRSLRVDGSGLDDKDVKLLASSKASCALRWLSLAHNRIGMAGAVAMARSENLRRLGYAWMFQNAIEPNQKYAYDNGIVVDDWMPKDGLELERIVGPRVRWLHHDARSMDDSVPDRFRME